MHFKKHNMVWRGQKLMLVVTFHLIIIEDQLQKLHHLFDGPRHNRKPSIGLKIFADRSRSGRGFSSNFGFSTSDQSNQNVSTCYLSLVHVWEVILIWINTKLMASTDVNNLTMEPRGYVPETLACSSRRRSSGLQRLMRICIIATCFIAAIIKVSGISLCTWCVTDFDVA